jgi:hypothetical protein
MKNKYIGVIPGNVKGADGTDTDLLTLLGVSVAPMAHPEVNDGRTDPMVAAIEVNGKLYDLKGVLQAYIGNIISVTDPHEGDILVYDAESGKFINVPTEGA